MTIKHTSSFKLAHKVETAYASGGGATANTPQELAVGDLTAVDKIIAFNAGWSKPEREELWHLASGLTPDEVAYAGSKPGQGHIKSYLQTSIFYDWAVAQSIGSPTGSKAFRFNDADDERDIYGGLVKKYQLICELNKPVYQDVEFLVAQQKHTGCAAIGGGGIPAFSTASKIKSNACAFTVDALTIANINLKKLIYTVENKYDEEDTAYSLTGNFIQNPALLERTHSFEIEFVEPTTNTWFTDEMNSTVQLVNCVLNFSLFTLTLANFNTMKTTQAELEQRGIIGRFAGFKQGVGATITKS